jgi:hypothetical protein
MRRPRALGLYAFVFGVAALAVVAGAAAAGLRLLTEPAAQHEHAQTNLGRPIPTSFGWVSINQVHRLRGPNAAELVRFQNGVEAMQVSVTLTNLSGRQLTLSAAEFDLRVDATGALIAPGIWSLPYHPPRGQWAGKALFRFLVPAHGSLSFVFRDPGRRQPMLIPIGDAASAPEASLNLDSHPGHGSYP